MNLISRSLFIMALIVVALVTVATSVLNHFNSVARFERVEEMLHNPQARPDAWTATQDDERMLQCEKDMKRWVIENFRRKGT